MLRRDFLKTVAASVAALAAPVSMATNVAWPIWGTRQGETFRLDAATDDGYRLAMYMLRDVQQGRVAYPHPALLQLLSWSQVWLAGNGVHSIYNFTSGARFKETNDHTEGAAKNSLHIPTPQGYFFAADFRASGLTAAYTGLIMQEVGMGGVGVYWQRDFVHADVGRRRTWRGL